MLELLVTRIAIRDWFIIFYCLLGIIVFFFAAILIGALIWLVLSARGFLKDIINGNLKPTLNSIKETAESIKGTTDFMGDKAASPVIRTYGMVAGVRRGLGVLSGLSRMRKGE
jgi:hypothetical protein